MSPIQWPCSSPTFFGIGMFKISHPAIWIWYIIMGGTVEHFGTVFGFEELVERKYVCVSKCMSHESLRQVSHSSFWSTPQCKHLMIHCITHVAPMLNGSWFYQTLTCPSEICQFFSQVLGSKTVRQIRRVWFGGGSIDSLWQFKDVKLQSTYIHLYVNGDRIPLCTWFKTQKSQPVIPYRRIMSLWSHCL